jgi:cation transport ATPase
VVVKGGGALEQLGRGEVLLFDKTGTVTTGRPTVVDVVACADLLADAVLSAAASLDQTSPHVLATALVRAARERGVPLVLPTNVEEAPGHGVRGFVDGHWVAVGKPAWAHVPSGASWARAVRRRAERDGMMTMFVAVDGRPVGAVVLEDPVRTDAARTIRQLRRDGSGES